MMAATTTIITGGNSGLGYHCAKAIAREQPQGTVVIASRDTARVAAAVNRLRAEVPGAAVVGMTLDLASLTAIRQFTQDLAAADLPPLGALVCNAGVQVVTGTTTTVDGFETTFGVNHLGHFLLANLLLPRCVPRGRIVFVSSDTHDPAARTGMPAPAYPSAEQLARPAPLPTGVTMGELGRQRYTTSKLCNVLCAYEFARRLRARQSAITVNAFNPGLMLDTGLVRDYSKGEMMSLSLRSLRYLLPQILRFRSARNMGPALARLVIDPALADVSGAYFDGYERKASSAASNDLALAAALWDTSRDLTGLPAVETTC